MQFFRKLKKNFFSQLKSWTPGLQKWVNLNPGMKFKTAF